MDDEGRLVVPAWIEAVEPVADPLRDMTLSITGDVRNVSQVTEEAVHSLSARFGENLGRKPSGQILISAKWRARNLSAGGPRKRKRLEVALRDIFVDCAHTRPEFADALEARQLIARPRDKAHEVGRSDLETVIELYMSDAEDQIASVFGVRPNSRERNALTRRLYRGLRSLLGKL